MIRVPRPSCPFELRSGGSGTPLLLVGSLGTNRQMWESQIDELAADRPVVLIEHPGHDGVPVADAAFEIADLAEAVVDIATDAGFNWFDLAGLSLGGMVGMAVAASHPDRLRRLAIVCSSAHLPPPEGWIGRARTVRDGGTAPIAEAVVERWFTDGFRAARPDTVRWGVEMLSGVDPIGYARCCEAIASMDLRPILGRIAAETLVIAGADDRATPPAHAEVIAGAISGAGLRIVDEAAHLANVEQPDVVTALLLAHLDRNGSGRVCTDQEESR